MKTEYYASRSLARNAAKQNGGKVIDNGSKSLSGQRWAVVIQSREVLSLPAKVGYLNRLAQRTEYACGKNDKPVNVLHKRSKTAAFLARNLANMH